MTNALRMTTQHVTEVVNVDACSPAYLSWRAFPRGLSGVYPGGFGFGGSSGGRTNGGIKWKGMATGLPWNLSVHVHTGRSLVGRRPTGVAHSKIARVVFVLYVVGRAYWSAVFDRNESCRRKL